MACSSSVLNNVKKRATYLNSYEVITFLTSSNTLSLLSGVNAFNSRSSIKLALNFPYIVFQLLGYPDNALICFQNDINEFDSVYNLNLLDSYDRSFFNVGKTDYIHYLLIVRNIHIVEILACTTNLRESS